MNERSDIDRLLRHWIDDGPSTMPDRVIDVVADRISTQRQRRPWRQPWSEPMNLILKGAAAAAAVIVLIAAWNLMPRAPDGAGSPSASPGESPAPTTAPSSSASPSPTAGGFACDDPAFSCAGVLAPGDHTTIAFRPALTFTVATGWVNTLDRERALTLHDNESPGHFFQIMSQVAIPEQNEECSAARRAGVGNSVADWQAFLVGHSGLTASSPQAIDVGGHEGIRIDVRVADDWTGSCPGSLGPAVVLITDSGEPPSRARWIDDQRTTLRIVDVAGETVILYLETSPSPADLAAVNAELQPVIDTFRFAPPG
ncbi:MAG TPA: hypothetical protein VFR14_12870 [Candidatus Limnocylindrales bacterium]|nr:hypothetical protein [Candidatus Limnocylindrales bacterium]